jgi:3-oxoacyl-[acyl-carrier-protein] synthase II
MRGVTSNDRRVVITGCGVVSSIGHELEDFWRNCLAGCTRVEAIPSRWANFYSSRSQFWSPLPEPDYSKHGLRRAADDALANAALKPEQTSRKEGKYRVQHHIPLRSGVFCGTGLGCITSTMENYIPHLLSPRLGQHPEYRQIGGTCQEHILLDLLTEHPRVSPIASIKSMSSSISASLSIRYGFRGPNETIFAACAAGSWAVTRGFEAIKSGSLDLAICGGSEYFGDPAGGVFMAFDRLGTLATGSEFGPSLNRPFDLERSGFLFSQGGTCMLILESLEVAKTRRVRPLAEIVAVSKTSDAHSLVSIAESNNTIADMLESLAATAELSLSEINYINAHGTSTIQNDAVEAHIIRELFPHRPLVNSTKALLGHTIGAAGAIETAVTALSLRDQCVHGTLNLHQPVCDINFARQTQSADLRLAITQNFGFGGHNVGILMAKASD